MSRKRIENHSFSLGHLVKDIDQIEQAISELAEKWDVDEKSLFQLNLVLEELISNTMFYGFKGKDKGIIRVDMSYDDSHIHVSIADDALAFDPTVEVDMDKDLELNERQIGGLGIMLSQQISEDMTYSFIDGKNNMSFKIRLNDKSK
jgi:anti-sigma regulatory factor (Ser/Thr protein kinase)